MLINANICEVIWDPVENNWDTMKNNSPNKYSWK